MKLPFNVDLKDKVAVVTGGSGILCGAMAEALAACGAKVAILALGQEGCDAKADQIKAAGPSNSRSVVYSYPAHHLPETQDISGIPLPFL